MTLKPFVFAVLAALAVTEASAQTPPAQTSPTQTSPTIRRLPGGQTVQLQDGEMLVQAQRSVILPLQASDDQVTRQDDAVRMIYRTVDRDCALLLETIAESCELASLSVASSAGGRNRLSSDVGQTASANASFSMKVRLKSNSLTPR